MSRTRDPQGTSSSSSSSSSSAGHPNPGQMSYVDILAWSKLDAQREADLKKYGVRVSQTDTDLDAALKASTKAAAAQQRMTSAEEDFYLQEALRISAAEEEARREQERRAEEKRAAEEGHVRKQSFQAFTTWSGLKVDYYNYLHQSLPQDMAEKFNVAYRSANLADMQATIQALQKIVSQAKIADDQKRFAERQAEEKARLHKQQCEQLRDTAIELLKELATFDTNAERTGKRFDAIQQFCDAGEKAALQEVVVKLQGRIGPAKQLMVERREAEMRAVEKLKQEQAILETEEAREKAKRTTAAKGRSERIQDYLNNKPALHVVRFLPLPDDRMRDSLDPFGILHESPKQKPKEDKETDKRTLRFDLKSGYFRS